MSAPILDPTLGDLGLVTVPGYPATGLPRLFLKHFGFTNFIHFSAFPGYLRRWRDGLAGRNQKGEMKMRKNLLATIIAMIMISTNSPVLSQQIDRSYLRYYPQCDMSRYFNINDYLRFYGNPQTAQAAMLNDLYKMEIQCVMQQREILRRSEQQYWNKRAREAPQEEQYYKDRYWNNKADSFRYGN